jgi:YhcH/YjgK/YiaL family protein
MIQDCLDNAEAYVDLNPHFMAAFKFLRQNDIADLPEGRHEVDGESIYAVVAKGVGRKPDEALIETHDNYIDIQFVLEGTDNIGWKARKGLGNTTEASNPNNDVAFYEDTPTAWSAIGPGEFGIYFPEDGHLPMISDDKLHKVIMKVAVE